MEQLQKSNTQVYYDTNAVKITREYENVPGSRFLAQIIDEIPKEGKVLDLGCGSGRDAAYLYSLGFDVYGLDGSEAMLEEAKKLHEELTDRLFFQVLPGHIPFEDESLDAVVSIACLMHFDPDKIRRICLEMFRVLKQGGKALASIRRPLERSTPVDPFGRYYTPISTKDWEGLFCDTGFRVIRITKDGDALGRDLTWNSFLLAKD